jgi:hypothetical protein
MLDPTLRSTSAQHLDEAVRLLVGAGPVKQRLSEASVRHLAELDAGELPRDLVARYRALMGQLTAAPAIGGLGSIEASVRKMSEQDAAGCALQALDLCLALNGREGRDAALGAQPRQLRLVGDE